MKKRLAISFLIIVVATIVYRQVDVILGKEIDWYSYFKGAFFPMLGAFLGIWTSQKHIDIYK